MKQRPKIKLSWEHKSYSWLPEAEFMSVVSQARDHYMQMVYHTIRAREDKA